ncbi:MAG: mechanosensitive ion channel domain-containing protein [Promethearchaeota archaeon]
MNNFVAGVWISLTRPFNVGDYVEIGGKEGIIIEIVLNYTKIKHRDGNVTLIPNMSCLKSELINYSISKEWFKDRIKGLENIILSLKTRNINNEESKKYLEFKHLEEKLARFKKNYEEITQILKEIDEKGYKKYKKHSQYASEDRIVRYTFNLAFERNPKKINERLEIVCEKWAKEFEIKPSFRLLGIDSHLNYNFVILTPDPMDIINYLGEFFKDIYTAVYKK